MANRKTYPPAKDGCKKSKNNKHDWNYRLSWNGNEKKVLPFWEGTRGIPRSGWRCFHCGKIIWDESDIVFALEFAYHTNTLNKAVQHLYDPKIEQMNERFE